MPSASIYERFCALPFLVR